jgi:hypothetical protein
MSGVSAAVILTAAVLGFPPGDLPPVIPAFGPKLENYYKKPDPKLAEQFFIEILKPENIDHPWFIKRGDVLEIMGTQLGDLAKGKGERVRSYEAAFPSCTRQGKKLIIAALKVCGDEPSQAAVSAWLKDAADKELKGELEALQAHLADPERRHFRELPVKTPHDIDLLWGNFYITGEYEPVSRILDVFDRPEDDKDAAVLRRVGKFSLGSNLQRHPRLVEVIQKHRQERGAGSEKALSELIIEFKK